MRNLKPCAIAAILVAFVTLQGSSCDNQENDSEFLYINSIEVDQARSLTQYRVDIGAYKDQSMVDFEAEVCKTARADNSHMDFVVYENPSGRFCVQRILKPKPTP